MMPHSAHQAMQHDLDKVIPTKRDEHDDKKATAVKPAPQLVSLERQVPVTQMTMSSIAVATPTPAPAAHESSEERVQDLGPLRHGVVHNLKHAYGFVRCDETGDRIFFHYSAIDQDSIASLPPVPSDHPAVIIGDRVTFYRVRDEPTGKEKAVQVRVVARSAHPIVSPSPRDAYRLDYDAQPVKEVQPARRETGVVVSAKQNYGFIKCAERDHKQVFFHFTEVINDANEDVVIAPGTEVEFALVSTGQGRIIASRVRILPQGTVSFCSIQSSVIFGVIAVGVENTQAGSQKTRRRARPSSNDHGQLVLPGKERRRLEHIDDVSLPFGVDIHLPFTGADLKFPGIKLFQGDQVGFRLKLDRRTGSFSATDIFLVKCAALGRRRGILTIWKDVYGFLKCDGKRDQMFVHLNEFIEKAHVPAVGDELEFNVAPDNRGQDNAIRITLLPKGAVKLRDDRVLGVITEKPSIVFQSASSMAPPVDMRRVVSGPSGHDGTIVYGTIQIIRPSSSAVKAADAPPDDDVVRFVIADLETESSPIRVGDTVSLAMAPAPKFLRAANIRLAPKLGIVSEKVQDQVVVKVDATQHAPSELFEVLLDSDLDVRVGDQVEVDEFEAGIATRSMRIARKLTIVVAAGRGRTTPKAQLATTTTTEPKESFAQRNRKPHLAARNATLDLSPASHKRWDQRMEPRNWSKTDG